MEISPKNAKETKATSPVSLEAGVPLHVESALTVYTVEDTRRRLLEALAQSPCLSLDLSEVDTCDCAGLQLLCAARKTAQMQGKGYLIANCTQAILEAAEAIGLDRKHFLEPLQPTNL